MGRHSRAAGRHYMQRRKKRQRQCDRYFRRGQSESQYSKLQLQGQDLKQKSLLRNVLHIKDDSDASSNDPLPLLTNVICEASKQGSAQLTDYPIRDPQESDFSENCLSQSEQLEFEEDSDSASNSSLPPFVNRSCDDDNQSTSSVTCSDMSSAGFYSRTDASVTQTDEKTRSAVSAKSAKTSDFEFLRDPLFLRYKEFVLLSSRLNKVSSKWKVTCISSFLFSACIYGHPMAYCISVDCDNYYDG